MSVVQSAIQLDVRPPVATPVESRPATPALVESLKSHGHRNASMTTKQTLASDLKDDLAPGDLVICLGAGDITYWAAGLAEALAA